MKIPAAARLLACPGRRRRVRRPSRRSEALEGPRDEPTWLVADIRRLRGFGPNADLIEGLRGTVEWWGHQTLLSEGADVRYTIDTEQKQLRVERGGTTEVFDFYSAEGFAALSRLWVTVGWNESLVNAAVTYWPDGHLRRVR